MNELLGTISLYWDRFRKRKLREKIQKVIFSAEISAEKSGVSVTEILKAYYQQLKGEDEKISIEIRAILNRLNQGIEKSKVYRQYVSDDVYTLMHIAESRNLMISSLVQEYLPVKKAAEELLRSLKSSLRTPFFIFIGFSVVFSMVLGNMGSLVKSGLNLSPLSIFVINNYFTMMSIIAIFLFVLFFLFPHKAWGIKGMFKTLNGIIGVSISSVGMKMGLSSVDIVPMLKKYFKVKKKISGDIDGLVSILSNFLSPLEVADIVIANRYGKISEKLDEMKQDKMKEVEIMKKSITETVDMLSKLFAGIPVLPVVVVFLDLLTKAVSKVG